MSEYLVVLERTASGYGVYVPDLPGCASTGRTRDEAECNAREAIELHVQGLRAAGLKVPRPSSRAAYVTIAA